MLLVEILLAASLGAATPSPAALVRGVEQGKCGEKLASDLDAARGRVARDAGLSRRLSGAAAAVVRRCGGDRLGEASVFQAIKVVAELGPATCDDARAVREVALRVGHPSRAYLASAIQSCETGGTPARSKRAGPAPASGKEKRLTSKVLSMPCTSTVAERKLLVNRWAKLAPEERMGKLQELADGCAAHSEAPLASGR